MNIHRLEDTPPAELGAALARFERQFSYPLGAGRRFYLSHGEDYPRFFRAIGGAGHGVSFVAVNDEGEILGTLGVALRAVQTPGGEIIPSAYLGDLKTVPDARRARVLVSLAARAFAWGKEQGAKAAYGVVMDGTPRVPSTYSGRFGIPPFGLAGKISVLRVPTGSLQASDEAADETGLEMVESRFRALSRGCFAPLGGEPERRSTVAIIPLVNRAGRACGLLEDTRRAKRLLLADGGEMVSMHLSKFAYENPGAGAALLRGVLARCSELGRVPALFVSVPEVDTAEFLRLLEDVPGVVVAPATVYAAVFPTTAASWNINTSEI